MFLKELSSGEKNAFICLSIHAANADDRFVEQEKKMIDEYASEMEISVPNKEQVMTIEESISIFSKSDEHIKKVVLFETLGLLYSDGIFEQEERNFAYDYAEKVGLEPDVVDNQIKLLEEYLSVLGRVVDAM